ncbi:hypothetical protein ACOMHN_023712 [Nucella lapillus]
MNVIGFVCAFFALICMPHVLWQGADSPFLGDRTLWPDWNSRLRLSAVPQWREPLYPVPPSLSSSLSMSLVGTNFVLSVAVASSGSLTADSVECVESTDCFRHPLVPLFPWLFLRPSRLDVCPLSGLGMERTTWLYARCPGATGAWPG